jgi:N-acetylglucosamine-6-phosphate deacetylase
MTKTTLIENGTLYSPSGMQPDGWLLIRDGKITEKGFGSNKPAKVDRGFDAQGKWVIPGLVDLHIHGAGGFDASGKSLAGVQSVLPQYGITSFLATSYVTPRNVLEQSIRDMADVIDQKKSGAQIIGIHMEGPWRGGSGFMLCVNPGGYRALSKIGWWAHSPHYFCAGGRRSHAGDSLAQGT